MAVQATLLGDDLGGSPKGGETTGKSEKSKKVSILYAGFTAQEIMEFFDWGFVFPNGYLPRLLGENDFKGRFNIGQPSFVIQFFEEPQDPNKYYLRFDAKEMDGFFAKKGNSYYAQLPIPANFVRCIVCNSDKSKVEIEKLWVLSDHDEIDIELQTFKNVVEAGAGIEINDEKKQEVFSFIEHIDKCLGAICFTKDLDPFIKYNFEGYAGVEEFSENTFSRFFLSLIRAWAKGKLKSVVDDIIPADEDSETRFIKFLGNIADNKSDDNKDAYLQAMADSHRPINDIIKDMSDNPVVGEQPKAAQKIMSAIKKVELGISSLQDVLEDIELRKPYPLFTIFLKQHYRKGAGEADLHAFRQNLFEKDYINNPKNISILGALYGYYLGYHNITNKEDLHYLGDLDIAGDSELRNLFRPKLSPSEPFEKEAFNIIYNKVAENYKGFPQIKSNYKASKPKAKEIKRGKFSFIQLPQLGEYGYKVQLGGEENKSIKIFIDAFEKVYKTDRIRLACSVLIWDFLKEFKIPVNEVIKYLALTYKDGQPHIDLEINMTVLTKAVGNYLAQAKDARKFETELKTIVAMLERLKETSVD